MIGEYGIGKRARTVNDVVHDWIDGQPNRDELSQCPGWGWAHEVMARIQATRTAIRAGEPIPWWLIAEAGPHLCGWAIGLHVMEDDGSRYRDRDVLTEVLVSALTGELEPDLDAGRRVMAEPAELQVRAVAQIAARAGTLPKIAVP